MSKSIEDWIAELPSSTKEQRAINIAEYKKLKNTSMEDLMNNACRDYEEMIRNSANIPDDWYYKDGSIMLLSAWEEFVTIIGEKNIHILAGSQGNFKVTGTGSEPTEPWARYTYFVSPEACNIIRKYYNVVS